MTPLRARLHHYKLTASEFALLTAMLEHRSDGSSVWASVPRLACYAKVSVRTAQNVIRGLRLETHFQEIAGAIREFLSRKLANQASAA
jgi:hypothetical protein